jgi:hypothetical protein
MSSSVVNASRQHATRLRLPQAQPWTGSARHLARAHVVAFYERHLRRIASDNAYLTSVAAKARYVDTELATIKSIVSRGEDGASPVEQPDQLAHDTRYSDP